MISRDDMLDVAGAAGFVTDTWHGRRVVSDDYGDYDISDEVERLFALAYNRALADVVVALRPKFIADRSPGSGEDCVKSVEALALPVVPIDKSRN